MTGADSYEVQLFTSGQWTLLPGNGIEIAFYGAGAIISDLNPSDTLWFRVQARNAHGPSDWSAYYQMASTSQFQRGRQPRPDNVTASGAPVISGTTEVGETLTADTGGIEDGNGLDRVKFRFQWVSNNGGTDTVITDATDSTYTLVAADEDSTIKVRVDFTDRGGYSESLTSTATASVLSAGEGNSGGGSSQNSPATGAPTISGAAQVGETLTADTSGIADSDGLTNVSYSYQWISNDGTSDSDITDATGSSYTLVAANKDKTIKLRVSFTDDANNAETLTSATTGVVAGAPLTATFENVSGSHDGQTAFTLELTFSKSPALSFRTLKFHAFTVDDGTVKRAKRIEKGSNIRWNITVAPDSDADVTVTLPETTDCADSGAVCMGDGRKLSAPVSATIAGPEQNSSATGTPTISGTEQVGETLSADTSGISDLNGLSNATFSYQWVRSDSANDTDISGATGQTYTLATADAGNTVKVRVSFTDDDGHSETLTSAATGEVQQPTNVSATGLPTIAGTPQVGETLTADTSGIGDANGLTGVQYAYQWIRNDGTSNADISGATGQTYTLATADAGNTVKVRVSFTDDDGHSETLTSAATGEVQQPTNVSATGLPTITGTPQVGETLTADTSGIGDANGLTGVQYAYQWIRNDGTSDADISSATGSAYTLVDDDLGRTIKVRVSFTDDDWYAETLTSAAAETVAALSISERTYVELSGGTFHMCGIATGGSIYCWGEGNRGQTDPPEGVYKTLASGSAHTCAIATDGSIDCWGWNTNGQASPPTGTFKSIKSHSRHSCAIAVDDTIACWGYSSFHQDASPAGTYKSMAIGWEHTCTIKTDDTISCWGLNDHGEGDLPSGTYKAITAGFVHTCGIKSDDSIVCRGMNNRGQTEAPAGSYVSISAGEYHTCAIATDGTIACWGDSRSGRTNAPEGTYQSIDARHYHTCAIATDNSVSCWGGNTDGQTDSPSDTFTSTALAGYHTCGITTDGTVKCWGWNIHARSDTSSGTYDSAVMGRDHVCAIATDDTVSCWGYNEFGQADAPAGTYKHLAAGYDHTCAIATDDTVTCWGYGGNRQTSAPSGTYQSIASGYDHTCAIATDDTVSCWGLNQNGESDAPTGTYKAVTTGDKYTCAIATDDTITCWGYNEDGQTDAPAGTYQSISAGKDHSCAVATNGNVDCWGNNEHGKTDAADGTFQSVSASEYHTCAITTDDTITCWGHSGHGRLRAPTGTYQSVSAGVRHSCAVATDNTIVCWGNNQGGISDAPSGTYQSITVHTDHTVAIATDGTLVAWPGLPEGVTWVGGD